MTSPLTPNELIEAFISHFSSLPEREQFRLGALFNEKTGGKLSPYNSPNPVAVAIVPIESPEGLRVLGVRRAIAPKIGEVALPGGFVNPHEEPMLAARREVKEETGLDLAEAPLKIQSAQAAGGNSTLLFYGASQPVSWAQFEALRQRLSVDTDGEAQELVAIAPGMPMAFPLHQAAVDEYFQSQPQPPRPKTRP